MSRTKIIFDEFEKKQIAVVTYRGAIQYGKVIPLIQRRDYSFLKQQKMGYFLSYYNTHYGFHAVDRFASFPLFYIIHQGIPIVSENVDKLLPYLPIIELDPIGYYTSTSMGKAIRSHNTPFKGIKRIPPGHYLEYKDGGIQLKCYWSFKYLIGHRFTGNYEEACEELGYLVKQSVKRCQEFAPNAALHLSGGMDSGNITAIMCQLSGQKRYAFAQLSDGAPLESNRYESGFIQKYQRHYPHLSVEILYRSQHSEKRFKDANNWYLVSSQDAEIKICQKVKTLNKQFILTGLGGDELASYGNRGQDVGFSIHNDLQAKIYLNWYIRRLGRWKNRIKILIRKKESWVDSLEVVNFSKLFLRIHNFGFTPSFQSNISEWLSDPAIAPAGFPSSFAYRLRILDRTHFTRRSDIWNYVGSKYDVDYLHPLLDADLITFCVSLPRHFFRQRERREMIKTALKNQLPSDLLAGTKRPLYSKFEPTKKETLSLLEDTQTKLINYKTSYAANVFNYNKMDDLLENYKKLLQNIPSSHQQTIYSIFRLTHIIRGYQLNGDYLNKYF